ncbi:MAG: hypothetical protein KDJ34_17695 [Candidatus Competibacteraceae bacterium]|nr:hypothetical protein [Candidatus Competibacteraceae bacterium]MCP5133705.1 hypothetical protein [Gammaproteobacteria bacterium]
MDINMINLTLSRHCGTSCPYREHCSYLTQSVAGTSAAPELASDDRLLCFTSHMPTLKQATDLLIQEALRRSGGNQTAAAKLLGISQQALSKRLRSRE